MPTDFLGTEKNFVFVMWNISTVSDCCRCADEVKSLRLGAGQFAQLSNGRAMTERGKGEEVEERESEGGSSLPDPAESRWVCGGGGMRCE